jgi:Domain of Unknown Function (DUF326)
MSYARRILDTYSHSVDVDTDALAVAIEALNDCAQACTADVDADLSEPNVTDMVTCIRLCLHCADLCTASAGITSRLAEYEADAVRPLLEACVATCMTCAAECERHARMHEHCRFCAEACRRCEQACRQLLATLKTEDKTQRTPDP